MARAESRVAAELQGLPRVAGMAWGGFLATHAGLTRQMNAELEAAHGLPLRSYDVLRQIALAPDGRLRLSDLAERVMLTRPGLSGAVARLEKEGLLARTPDPADGRGAFASLTALGERRLLEAHRTHVRSIRERFASRLSQEEMRALARVWSKLAEEPPERPEP